LWHHWIVDGLPSGKLDYITVRYGKLPFGIGKYSTVNEPLSIAMQQITRGNILGLSEHMLPLNPLVNHHHHHHHHHHMPYFS